MCLCLVFALLSPTFTFAISDGASDVAEKTIFENAADMRGNGSTTAETRLRWIKSEQTQQISCIRNSMTLHIILDMAEGLAELQL